MICDNISVNEKGHLAFAGQDTVELAQKYGTPLYLMDENKIRQHVRTYKNAMAEYMPKGSMPEFASKAFSCKQVYRIMAEEGIDIDAVSCGEIYTAFSAGFPMENCFFHGNNKTDSDIAYAMEKGVGYFIIDNREEYEAINRIAKEKGITQKALLRVTPGIDPHTHKKISTGSEESKFGLSIKTGMAEKATKEVLALSNIKLCGFHCHIGSQIFESTPFETAAQLMFEYIADIKAKGAKLVLVYGIGRMCHIAFWEPQFGSEFSTAVLLTWLNSAVLKKNSSRKMPNMYTPRFFMVFSQIVLHFLLSSYHGFSIGQCSFFAGLFSLPPLC